MPCEGFNGPMSCACAEECFKTLERHSTRGRFLAIKDKICFEQNGRAPSLSDAPRDLSKTRFYCRWRLSLPVGWELDPRVPAGVGGWVNGRLPRWAVLADARRLKAIRPVNLSLLPNSRCTGSCSHAGTCVDQHNGHGPQCRLVANSTVPLMSDLQYDRAWA